MSPTQKFKESFLSDYLDAAKQYSLFNQDKLDYFINLFREDAKRHFRQYMEGNTSVFGEAVDIMHKEFDSPARQLVVEGRATKQLESIRYAKLQHPCCSGRERLFRKHSSLFAKKSQRSKPRPKESLAHFGTARRR